MAQQQRLAPPIAWPEGRLYVGSPHQAGYAEARTTQEPGTPDFGGGPPGAYSVGPGARGESMWIQPQWFVSPPMPAQHAQPEIARGLYEVTGAALPTFVPRGYRAAATANAEAGWPQQIRPRFLLVPPDRYNTLANARGGNRRGAHDVAARGRFGLQPSRRRIPGVSIGS